MSTSANIIIRVSTSDATSLFDGVDTATLATIDVPASIERFEEILIARIQEAYPNADVAHGYTGSSRYEVAGLESDHANAEATFVVQQIAEDLYIDGNLWMVDVIAHGGTLERSR